MKFHIYLLKFWWDEYCSTGCVTLLGDVLLKSFQGHSEIWLNLTFYKSINLHFYSLIVEWYCSVSLCDRHSRTPSGRAESRWHLSELTVLEMHVLGHVPNITVYITGLKLIILNVGKDTTSPVRQNLSMEDPYCSQNIHRACKHVCSITMITRPAVLLIFVEFIDFYPLPIYTLDNICKTMLHYSDQ